MGSRPGKPCATDSRSSQRSALAHDELIGKTLVGKYLIEDQVGFGGMGTVYRALHVDIGHPVALKVLRAELCADWEQLERFRREAKAAASLSHPNVAQVTDLHMEAGQPAFIVMELVDGTSLEELLPRDGRFTLQRGALLIRQVLSALAVAHDAGIVHREL